MLKLRYVKTSLLVKGLVNTTKVVNISYFYFIYYMFDQWPQRATQHLKKRWVFPSKHDKCSVTYIKDEGDELFNWFRQQGFTVLQIQFSFQSFSHIYLKWVEFSRQLKNKNLNRSRNFFCCESQVYELIFILCRLTVSSNSSPLSSGGGHL